MIYLHNWVQSIELLLFVWFVVWAVSKILDFCRAGMERVRQMEAKESAQVAHELEREGK